jgi:hypothetical protein
MDRDAPHPVARRRGRGAGMVVGLLLVLAPLAALAGGLAGPRPVAAPPPVRVTALALLAGSAPSDASLLDALAAVTNASMERCITRALDALGAPSRPLAPTPPVWMTLTEGLPSVAVTLPPAAASGYRPQILIDRRAWRRLPTDAQRQTVLAHELTHALLLVRGIDHLPPWLDEGLAVWIGAQCSAPDVQATTFVRQQPLLRPMHWPSTPAPAPPSAYALVGTWTAWLLTRGAPGAAPLGAPPAALGRRAWLAQTTAPDPPAETLAAWGAALLLADPAHPVLPWPRAFAGAGRLPAPALLPPTSRLALLDGTVALIGPFAGPQRLLLRAEVPERAWRVWGVMMPRTGRGAPYPAPVSAGPAAATRVWVIPCAAQGMLAVGVWHTAEPPPGRPVLVSLQQGEEPPCARP